MSRGRGVVYMLTGDKHAVQLVVSIYCLRQSGWDGPIALIAGCDNSKLLGGVLGSAADVQLVPWDAPRGKPRGVQYANKTFLGELSPYDESVFLDADTLPVGDFSKMFPEDDEVRITRFVDWVTTGSMMGKRIREWSETCPELVQRQTAEPYPAINTGVIGFSSRCAGFMNAWRELCHRNIRFICDEIACQLMFPDHPHLVLDQRWNCSPIYCDEVQSFDREDVRIWHGHGWKFIKKHSGRAVWLPWYKAAVADNFAGLADWTPGSDKKLKAFLSGEKYQ